MQLKNKKYRRIKNLEKSNRIAARIQNNLSFTDAVIGSILVPKMDRNLKFFYKSLKVLEIRKSEYQNVVVFASTRRIRNYFQTHPEAFEKLQAAVDKITNTKNKIIFSIIQTLRVQKIIAAPNSQDGWNFQVLTIYKSQRKKRHIRKDKKLDRSFLDAAFEEYVFTTFNEKLKDSLSWLVGDKPFDFSAPIFIYAKNGLGRTNFIKILRECFGERRWRVCFVEGYKLTNRSECFISEEGDEKFDLHSPSKTQKSFEVFIFDDIHLVRNHEVAENLAGIINEFTNNKKRVIVSGNAFPEALNHLGEVLYSRLKESVVLEINYLDSKSFEDIFSSFENKFEIDFKEEDRKKILDFFQLYFSESLRALRGGFLTLKSYCVRRAKIFAIKDIERIFENRFVLRNDLGAKRKLIVDEVSNFFGVKSQSLWKKKKRIADEIYAKHIAVYLFKTLLNQKLVNIANYFREKSHSTASSTVEKIDRQLDNDSELKQTISMIVQRLEKRGLRIEANVRKF